MSLNLTRRALLKTAAAFGLLWGSNKLSPALRSQPVQATANPATNATLEEQIGQMLLVGFRGLSVDANHPVVRDLVERQVGGVILFDYDVATNNPVRNIESPQQVRDLVARLQRFARQPLFVSVDQEGGQVTRLKERHGFPATVSHQYLGQQNDLALTYQQAALIAGTLVDVGVNLNFAPVLDLNINPSNPIIGSLERSFSADPAIVTAHARAFVAAHHDRGIVCCPKHFPGHGSSTTDSHLGLTDVTTTWQPSELQPYGTLIDERALDLLMTAHVFNAQLDANDPATLSPAVLRGLLRGDLGYDGLIISDDLQMGAITNQYNLETALAKAINAGVDILIFTNNTTVYDEAIATRASQTIQRLVERGAITSARIARSYERIIAQKQWFAQWAVQRVSNPSDPAVAYFVETGHTLRGAFLAYWQANGGLAQFGYPLTELFVEAGYTVQYFERARFEYHPEHTGTAQAVQLGMLGRELTADRQQEDAFQPSTPGSYPGRYVDATGHHLAPAFDAYWQANGGLAIYGYPISAAFMEPHPENGRPYLVQYFERNRFEHHPENTPPYNVQLGMLGSELLRQRGWLD